MQCRHLMLHAACAVLAAAASAPALGQNLLTDPSFEDGVVSACDQAIMPDTWESLNLTPDTYSFDCDVAMGLGPMAFGNFPSLPAAHSGLRFAAGAETADITPESFGQIVSGLVPGDTYRFSGFFARSDRHTGAGEFEVWMADATDPMARVYVGSLGSAATQGAWTEDAVEFTMPNLGASQYLELWPHALTDPAACYMAADDLALEWVASPVAAPAPHTRTAGATLALASRTPVRGVAQFAITLPAASAVRVTIHDAGGRLIATLCDGPRAAGRTLVAWDGQVRGAVAASGVYTAQLSVGGRTVAEQLCLVVR